MAKFSIVKRTCGDVKSKDLLILSVVSLFLKIRMCGDKIVGIEKSGDLGIYLEKFNGVCGNREVGAVANFSVVKRT